MLLGLSSLHDDAETEGRLELSTVATSEAGDGGVRHGALLSRFAELVHERAGLDDTRPEMVDALGEEGLVDAAAICANFNMMVRIADGTGTPLDEGTVAPSAELRDDLGLDELTSRRVAQSQPT
ncbi:MAG: hypothetical protein OEV40_03930 [Acidimicrobiia bacterium]|nr:hypothetical protein [Acidimicrobiia bacterium]